MKKQIGILSLLFLVFLVSYAVADDQVITLKDGSQIKGNLIGVSNGVYTIDAPALGKVNVDASKVASISNGEPIPAATATPTPQQPPADDINQKIDSAQNTLMNDPAMMQRVQEMAQDPEMMKLLSDPEIMRAVTSHDVKAIEANPKAQELMSNPKMRALMDDLRTKTSSQ